MELRLVLSFRRAPRLSFSSLRTWLMTLMMLSAATLLSACGGSDTPPPAGLSYAMTSAVYEAGRPIVPNSPISSGGWVARYSVAPPLPAGLSINEWTGVISGTPVAVTAPAVHTVTGENKSGTATARVEIEVRQTPAAPAGLSYRELTPTYTVGMALAPNTPTSTGGPITHYGVAPALPAGLAIDATTGVIGGTPTTITAASDYVVTGTNVAGSTTVTLRLAVQSGVAAPASVSYSAPVALYVTNEPVVPNTPQVTGGPASAFSVAPALPAGLSLNATTGAITGTPGAIQSQSTYVVTASNSAGSAQAQVKISVTSRGSWTAVPPVSVGRHYAAAVKLQSGKVLYLGGNSAGPASGVADLYDPLTDSWSSAAPMLVPRSDPSATVLLDGRVLVTGGDASITTSLASAELYDPVANTWTATGSMNEARTRHTASLLPDGKVLVIGGYRAGPLQFSQTAERYDPTTGTWTLMATPLSVARAQHGGQLLADGSAVLLVGGINGGGHLTSAELFPTNDNGSTTFMPGVAPAGNVYTSVRLADVSVLSMTDGSTTAVRFNPISSTWTTSTLASGSNRVLPTMTALADGRVLLAGGVGLVSAEIYNPDINTWTAATSMSTLRSRAAAVLLDDGSVLVIGGDSGSGELSAVERFTP